MHAQASIAGFYHGPVFIALKRLYPEFRFAPSGGPLVVVGKDQQLFLAGVTSWGIGCARPIAYSVGHAGPTRVAGLRQKGSQEVN